MFFGKFYTADKNFTQLPVATNSNSRWAACGRKIKDISGILKEILAIVFFFVCLTVGGPMVGVCGTNTFAGRAVPRCPQTAGFTCGAAQETQEIKKEHKENNTTENTLLYISFRC